MELRDYQLDTIEHLLYSPYERECIGSPTGSGKTFIFTNFAAALMAQEKKTLIVVHRKELLEQTRLGFINFFNYHPILITADSKNCYQEHKHIYLGMVETLSRRNKILLELKEKIDCLIIDEAHLACHFKLLEGFKRIIGFSATPQYIKKEDCLKNYYHNLYEPTDITDLLAKNYLVPPITFAPKQLVAAFKNMKLGTSKGDFKETDQEREINKVFADVIENIQKYKRGRTIIFHPSVHLSKEINQTLIDLGYESYHIDGYSSMNERTLAKQRLKEHSEVIVNNCGVLTTGFDEQNIETVVLNRLTKSENLLIQMVGRGARLGNGIEKKDFILLDLFGNTLRLGLWESWRNWEEKFSNSKESKDGEAPVKLCPQCETVVSSSVKLCPQCGYIFETIKADGEKQKSDLIVVNENYIQDRVKILMEKVNEAGHKPFSALYRLADFVFRNRKNKSDEILKEELMVGLKEWVDNNKDNPKVRYNEWYKNRLLEIYKGLK